MNPNMLKLADHNNKHVFDSMFLILICFIGLDVVVSTVFDLSEEKLNSMFGLALFLSMACITFAVANGFVLPTLKTVYKKTIGQSALFAVLYKTLLIAQLSVTVIFAVMVFEFVFFNSFHSIFKVVIIAVSYFEASFILGAMGYKLLSWFRVNPRGSKTILLYLLSMVFASFSLGLSGLVVFNGLILNDSLLIQPNKNVVFPVITFESFGVLFTLFSITLISYISAYLSIWIGTVSLFHTYLKTRNLRKKKIWIFAFASLFSYLTAIIPTLIFIPSKQLVFDDQSLLYFRILFKISVISSGIFFGIIFIVISNSMTSIKRKSSAMIGKYSRMSAYGITALTIITVSQPYVLSYPPFGIISSAFGALASFIIAIGFYSMAISASQETHIRHLIAKELKEADLIGKLGTAHRAKEIEKKVMDISKEKTNALKDQTGIEYDDSDEAIKNHLDEIIKEMQQQPFKKNKGNLTY